MMTFGADILKAVGWIGSMYKVFSTLTVGSYSEKKVSVTSPKLVIDIESHDVTIIDSSLEFAFMSKSAFWG